MRKSLAFLVIISIFVFGCTATKTAEQAGTAHTGTQGIDFDFVQNYPPALIYTPGAGDTGNSIVLEVKNKGAYTTGATFYLSGYDPSILNIGSNTNVVGTIEGKTPT